MTAPYPAGGGSGTACDVQASGRVNLYFYGELDALERAELEGHLPRCAACRQALEELTVIRRALARREVVDAPPGHDWSRFMSRLDRAIAVEPAARPSAAVIESGSRRAGSLVPWMAMAALLTLVTIGVVSVARTRGPVAETAVAGGEDAGEAAVLPFDDGAAAALAAVGQQHFERSKLVLLGLANKDAQASGTDWIYERDLASRLLVDTRLYRLAAEERGLGRLAGIMRDLELVLLQTAMTEGADPDALSQIQRAIRRRDLLQKMDMVRTTTGI